MAGAWPGGFCRSLDRHVRGPPRTVFISRVPNSIVLIREKQPEKLIMQPFLFDQAYKIVPGGVRLSPRARTGLSPPSEGFGCQILYKIGPVLIGLVYTLVPIP